MADSALLDRLLLKEEVTEFLLYEADLLDEHRYDEWLDLLTEDLSYTMPLRLNVGAANHAERELTAAGSEVCWFDEGKATLRKRVAQLRTGVHWAEEPLSRVSHLVTNVRILAHTEPEVSLSCRFLVHRNRVSSETDFFVGRRNDTLRRVTPGESDPDRDMGQGGGEIGRASCRERV